MDGFAEANLLLTSALEQLDDIILNGNNRENQSIKRKNQKNINSLSKSPFSTPSNIPPQITDEHSNTESIVEPKKNVPKNCIDIDNGNETFANLENKNTTNLITREWKNKNEIRDHNSDRMSSTESSPSELPTSSSSLFDSSRIYQEFVRAIHEQTIVDVPDLETQLKIMQWITGNQSPSPSVSTVSYPEYPELQDRINRLAMARDSLQLQVSVLSEQVSAQKEKIKDLESNLALKRNNLTSTEELLQDKYHCVDDCKELESKKINLLAEVSSLKLQFAALEREKNKTEHKLRLSQNEMNHVNQSMHGMAVQQQLKQNNIHNSYMAPLQESYNEKQDDEMVQLRNTVLRLIADNEKKSHQIDSLRSALDERMRSRPQHDDFYVDRCQDEAGFDVNVQLRRLLANDQGDIMSHSSSFPVNLYSNNSGKMQNPSVQSSSSYTSSLSTALPSQRSYSNMGTPRHLQAVANHGSINSINRCSSPSSPAARQLAAELDELKRNGAEASLRDYSTTSLPRGGRKATSTLALPYKKSSVTSAVSVGELTSMKSVPARSSKRNYRAQMNRWINEKFQRSRRTTSAPNLADSDENVDGQTTQQNTKTLSRDRTRSSLRNIFSKFTRSTSQEQNSASTFRRNSAARSTSMARLAPTNSSRRVNKRPPLSQFVDWRSDMLAEWIFEIGYPQYSADVEKNVRNGRHFLNMSTNEFETVLNIKHGLHRKRLDIMLRGIENDEAEPDYKWDVHMTLRWLDDIGLPQYKDAFYDNTVDSYLLLSLTAGDLIEMRINNAHHYATIARSIQLLKLIHFNLDSMEKHMDPQVIDRYPCPDSVVRWTHQATCEWLRKIDLAEFTPNLLCAGVPGSLMIYEPTFTAESLAEILQMPTHKTLLRRHLTSHFNQLVGHKIIADKRDFLASGNYPQISAATKVKVVRKGFSLTRKKVKNEVCLEPDELLCPKVLNHKYPTSNAEISSFESFNV